MAAYGDRDWGHKSKPGNILDKIESYRREVGPLDPQGLYFIVPANIDTAHSKTAFIVKPSEEVGKWTLTPTDSSRKPFTADYKYLSRKTAPFLPNQIMQAGLSGLFSGGTLEQFQLYDKYPDARRNLAVNKFLASKKGIIHDDKYDGAIKHTNEEEPKMKSKTQTVVATVKDVNIEAVKATAKIAAGKALNTAVQAKIVPKMPLMVRGYASTDLGKILLANVAATALTYYAPDNEKAKMVSEAMIQAAMLDLMANFDIEGMVNEFLSSDAAKRITDSE